MKVFFAHGKESGPWGSKIEALASVARLKGFEVENPDYSNQPDPDLRVKQLLTLHLSAHDVTVLVGSSMGGYVSTVATQIMTPVGLFLMAPAFYLSGYRVQNPVPHARKTVIVHGLNDEVVPVRNSIRFACEHKTELHLIDSDHRLNDQLPMLEMLFGLFLNDVLELRACTTS
jgi:predicted alpha/beta-hydrolase family hydrolase